MNNLGSSSMWAITAYFNPVRYQRRLANYRVFHRHLGIPLLTVELGFGGRYELTAGDATSLIQLPGQDVMWQKERLLNIAIANLPPQVTKVVWLDCDILFERDAWSEHASSLLEDYPIVQVFDEMVRLPRQEAPSFPDEPVGIESRPSICKLLSPATDLRTVCRDAPKLPGRLFPGPIGFGWAFRRSLLQQRGFYDVGILGGGDASMLAALSGCYEIAIDAHRLNSQAAAHYLRWAKPLYEEVSQRVACVPSRIFHLWHGELAHRGYETRYERLSHYQFDPKRDISLNEQQVWRWSSSKPEMHRYVANYFQGRREDGELHVGDFAAQALSGVAAGRSCQGSPRGEPLGSRIQRDAVPFATHCSLHPLQVDDQTSSFMSLPIALDAVPRELAAMLACQPQKVEEVVPITGLVGKHADEGASYRVTFCNGVRSKARSWPSHKDVGDVARILDRLPPDRFPRMLAFESRASLEQWFDGDVLANSTATEELLLDSGRLLGLIHQTSLPEEPTAQGWRSTNDCARRLESKLNRLVSLRVIDRRSAATVWEKTTAERPAYARYGLAHRDFCGENLVVSRGKVCCVDNVTFATLALDEDLARTWYRWPMADASWRIFLRGYAETRDVESFLRSGLFWKANVLAGSILMRLRCGLPAQAQVPRNRLLATFRLLNSVDIASARRAA